MATMLWRQEKVTTWNIRTGSHFYSMHVKVSENRVIATGGAHQYQDGPGPVHFHEGYRFELTPADFPADISWRAVRDDPITNVASIKTRHFDTFDEFLEAL